MREIEIERLVQWAYRDELPKRGIGTLANRWDNVNDYGERGGVRIDDEPGFPAALGVPHLDAVTIEGAVNGLNDQVGLDWREYRELLLGDVIGIAPLEDQLSGRVFSESALVATFARMGETPLWRGQRPLPNAVTKKGVVMLVGHCEGKDRYSRGSHCLVKYQPPVEMVAFRRAEYLVWHDGLVRLAGILRAWTLRDYVALPPKAPKLPWLDGHRTTPAPIPGVPAFAWPPQPIARGDKQRIKTAANSGR